MKHITDCNPVAIFFVALAILTFSWIAIVPLLAVADYLIK